ncbi:hypothetical protein ACHAW6_005509 [Cyclotella cf. meneghiniana]
MKFVSLVSGGKDSIYSIIEALRHNHELLCCAHLAPPIQDSNGDHDESYMYQTAGSEAVRRQVEECIGVPFYTRTISGKSCNTALVYHGDSDAPRVDGSPNDEVEDLFLLLQHVTSCHPDIEAVASGAILSTYQRTRIENVCSRLNLTSLAYLWRMDHQAAVLDAILDNGIDAVLVRVACPPGLTCRHLGQSLRSLRDGGVLKSLHEKWGINVAGEGGEYETLVVDCPIFKHGRLVLEETQVVEDGEDGVGVLRIHKCRVEKKEQAACTHHHHNLDEQKDANNPLDKHLTRRLQQMRTSNNMHSSETWTPSLYKSVLQSLQILPNVRIMLGGLCHISSIVSPTSFMETNNTHHDDARLAVQEFLSILETLRKILNKISSHSPSNKNKPQNDIFYVHLYLSQISYFASINQHYKQFFGMHLPPSRSCVGLGINSLPSGRRVMMDCTLQLGSGEYLRVDETNLTSSATTRHCDDGSTQEISQFVSNAFKNKHHSLRKTLHVQSMSQWAPVCIGPYSQANVLRSSLVFLAGMIGLVPESMQLIRPPSSDNECRVLDWEIQLYQSWRNAAAVLDGLDDGRGVLGGKLEDCIGGLVYFSLGALEATMACSPIQNCENLNRLPWNVLWKRAECVCQNAIAENGGIVMGSVDGLAVSNGLDPNLYDEDGVLYGGYEDEETWREMTASAKSATPDSGENENDSHVPLLMVCLQELPMNAQAEVELVCASRRAASCLRVWTGALVSHPVTTVNDYNNDESLLVPSDCSMLWDTGYDYPTQAAVETVPNCNEPKVWITSVARAVGNGCACVSTVAADLDIEENKQNMFQLPSLIHVDMEDVLSEMIESAIITAAEKGGADSPFSIEHVLNVRLYYVAAVASSRKAHSGVSKTIDESDLGSSIQVDMIDDGTTLRTLLHAVLASKCKRHRTKTAMIPAYTVVPVLGIYLSTGSSSTMVSNNVTFLAMQITLVDTIRMETDMWIRYGRDNRVKS